MTDRELLELAAKAAGSSYSELNKYLTMRGTDGWNPLTDDGDAFANAVEDPVRKEWRK